MHRVCPLPHLWALGNVNISLPCLYWICCHIGILFDFASPQPDDQDGSILLVDTILQQVCHLIGSKDHGDLTEEEIGTLDTLVYIVVDIYLQSELEVKITLANLFGNKYIQCLIDLNQIVHYSYGKHSLVYMNNTDTLAHVETFSFNVLTVICHCCMSYGHPSKLSPLVRISLKSI